MEEQEQKPGLLKQGADVALGGLETYGKGIDYLNDQVTLGNILESNPLLKTPFNIARQIQTKVAGDWVDKIYDYSYKDLRDHVSEGVGWTTKKVTGNETAGNVAELGTQILLPDAVDFAAGGLPIGAAGKLKFLNVFKRGSKTANKYVDATATVSKLDDIGRKINRPNLAVELGDRHLLDKLGDLDGVFTKNSITEKALSYKRQAFNVSKKSIPEIKNKFIKDLTEISGLNTATVTKKYDEILTSGRIKKPRNFAGTEKQYRQVKAYFQSIQDLGIEKKKSLYTVIDTADGPKKYFPDFKGGTANRAAVISLDAKLARVKITNKKRWQRILNQTLNKEDIGNWHTKMAKELGDEAHHLNELHLIGVMTDGRSIDSQLSVIKRLNDELIFTGNSTFNKFNLPVKVHDRVHNEMRKVFADYKNIDFAKMSNDQLVNFFKTDYKPKIQQIQETIFSEMQLYRKAK